MVEWKNGIAKITLPTPFSVGDVHTYLIKGERLTLIDAGVKTEEAWQRFNEQLAELKLTPADIEQVILTHHHPDHVGLLSYLSASIEVYAHPWNERWLNRSASLWTMEDEFYEEVYRQFGVPEEYYKSSVEKMKETLVFVPNICLTGYLYENDSPSGIEGWKVIETHGHAQGHIALWREQDGFLIGGDVLLSHISPNPLLEPPLSKDFERPKPQLQYNESLSKLAEYPIAFVLAGHGADVTDAHTLIKKRLASQHQRAMQVKNMLVHEPRTAFQICRELFPKVYELETGLTISETVAQLDYLLSLSEIKVVEGEQTLLYYAAK
ncbi:MBL fold metallo-hydrolase [Bacillus sp. B15-48]|uniref:MBL fold metallo-hydrolase n=1 Tax=Bacillus sp. B15-48 TaxID=1548601 RepID=UPI00193FB3BD|nr:MBL fold metallo-hydrolase [Bacillus sp. B15-48]MBM4762209.1 MBL fold metallo-hydrolase [Bacillus sp. B15-48]